MANREQSFPLPFLFFIDYLLFPPGTGFLSHTVQTPQPRDREKLDHGKGEEEEKPIYYVWKSWESMRVLVRLGEPRAQSADGC